MFHFANYKRLPEWLQHVTPKKAKRFIALFFQSKSSFTFPHQSVVMIHSSPSNPSPWGFLGSKLVDPHLSKNSPKNPLILDTRPGKRLQFAP